jgi:putative FmdB family regulatory protein
MPIYEYRCPDCDRTYEQLRKMSEADCDLECPHCGSRKPERQLSTFACSSGGTSGGSGCAPRGGFS